MNGGIGHFGFIISLLLFLHVLILLKEIQNKNEMHTMPTQKDPNDVRISCLKTKKKNTR